MKESAGMIYKRTPGIIKRICFALLIVTVALLPACQFSYNQTYELKAMKIAVYKKPNETYIIDVQASGAVQVTCGTRKSINIDENMSLIEPFKTASKQLTADEIKDLSKTFAKIKDIDKKYRYSVFPSSAWYIIIQSDDHEYSHIWGYIEDKNLALFIEKIIEYSPLISEEFTIS